MDILFPILQHPFTWGLVLGLIFAAIVFSKLRSFKQHYNVRQELEAKSMRKLHDELEGLRKENENLRIRVKDLGSKPENQNRRALEIYARAEKQMRVEAPALIPGWENAKSQAAAELEDEDSGKSLTKRIFSLFGHRPTVPTLPDVKVDALPES